MQVDRPLQRELLAQLKNVYPDVLHPQDIQGYSDHHKENLLYLCEHGLVRCETSQAFGRSDDIVFLRITHKGIDFLEDDGGLSAILGVVTVKFEADTLRSLLSWQVQQADIEPSKKDRILGNLKSLGSEGLKAAVQELAKLAIQQGPEAIRLLERCF